MASDITRPEVGRVKVQLKPGHHLVDWVRLNAAMPKPNITRKITSKELAKHNTKADCWTAYNGKVYNITNYLEYHPGGEQKLMAGAGKDCTVLFNKFHRWVNGHAMLSNCCIGTYVEETTSSSVEEGNEDEDEEEDHNSKKDKAHTHNDIDNDNDNSSSKKHIKLSKDGVMLHQDVLNQAISQLELSDDDDGGGDDEINKVPQK